MLKKKKLKKKKKIGKEKENFTIKYFLNLTFFLFKKK